MLQHAQRLMGSWIEPAQFDFWARQINRTWAWQRSLARVVSRRRESAKAVTLTLQANSHFRGFRPGQHLNVTVDIDGIRHTRCYSPSTPWAGDGRVSITVQQVDDGLVSKHMCTDISIGDVVELGEAFGDLTLTPTSAPPPLLMAAGGSGITPLICQLRALTRAAPSADITLLYWARSREELCFTAELRELANRLPHVRVIFGLSRDTAIAEDEISGRPSTERLADLVPDLSQRSVYCCGSDGFVDAVRTACQSQVAPGAFHAESFSPPTLSTSTGDNVRITLTRSGRELSLPAGQPLLEALEAEGLRPSSGCRMGICKTCACRKSAGVARNLNDGSVEAGPEDTLRLCISAAESDLTLDL